MPRPAIPIALHKVRGTGRASRLRKRADELTLTPSGIGEPPAWFAEDKDGYADTLKAEWDRVSNHPELSLVLAPAHRPTVEHHCLLFKRFLQDARGERTMTASERQTYHSIQMQLGWTPASQAKVHVPQPEKTDDKWARLASR